ncbi:Panacea domain-containing protein [Pseudoroseomonas wenyumeiae]
MQADDIARYFLAKADPEAGDAISNLKLQKLCYYAQGFHLALYDRPLFEERIEAWQHGPVVPDLYHEYKSYGSASIPVPQDLDRASYPEDVRELLDEVYSVYGQYSAWKLRNMTHEERPWIDAHQAGGAIIEHQAMSEYFKTLVQ